MSLTRSGFIASAYADRKEREAQLAQQEVTGAVLLAELIKTNELPVIANVTKRNESRSPLKEKIAIYGITEEIAQKIVDAVNAIKPFPVLEVTSVKANSSIIIKLQNPEAHQFGEPNGISLLVDLLGLQGVKIVKTDYNEKDKSPASR